MIVLQCWRLVLHKKHLLQFMCTVLGQTTNACLEYLLLTVMETDKICIVIF
jgi:hypothetical protein